MTSDDRLLNKVLEIVEVIGELRQQLNSFIESCEKKDEDMAKQLDDFQKRLLLIETQGTNVIRELMKEEATQIDSNKSDIKDLKASCEAMKKDIGDLKVDTSKANWRMGVIISVISIAVTLGVTELLKHMFNL